MLNALADSARRLIECVIGEVARGGLVELYYCRQFELLELDRLSQLNRWCDAGFAGQCFNIAGGFGIRGHAAACILENCQEVSGIESP